MVRKQVKELLLTAIRLEVQMQIPTKMVTLTGVTF